MKDQIIFRGKELSLIGKRQLIQMGKVDLEFPYLSLKMPVDNETSSKGLKWFEKINIEGYDRMIIEHFSGFFFMGFYDYFGNGFRQHRPVFRITDKVGNFFDYYFTKPNCYAVLDCSYNKLSNIRLIKRSKVQRELSKIQSHIDQCRKHFQKVILHEDALLAVLKDTFGLDWQKVEFLDYFYDQLRSSRADPLSAENFLEHWEKFAKFFHGKVY